MLQGRLLNANLNGAQPDTQSSARAQTHTRAHPCGGGGGALWAANPSHVWRHVEAACHCWYENYVGFNWLNKLLCLCKLLGKILDQTFDEGLSGVRLKTLVACEENRLCQISGDRQRAALCCPLHSFLPSPASWINCGKSQTVLFICPFLLIWDY